MYQMLKSYLKKLLIQLQLMKLGLELQNYLENFLTDLLIFKLL